MMNLMTRFYLEEVDRVKNLEIKRFCDYVEYINENEEFLYLLDRLLENDAYCTALASYIESQNNNE